MLFPFGQVRHLEPGSTHTFTVRNRDEAGNRLRGRPTRSRSRCRPAPTRPRRRRADRRSTGDTSPNCAFAFFTWIGGGLEAGDVEIFEDGRFAGVWSDEAFMTSFGRRTYTVRYVDRAGNAAAISPAGDPGPRHALLDDPGGDQHAPRSPPGRRSRRRASRPWRSCSRRRRRRRSAGRCWPRPMTRSSRRPARQALEGRARDLLAAARVGDRAGDDHGLARQRRVGGDLRRQVLLAHVEVDAALAQPLELRPQPLEVLREAAPRPSGRCPRPAAAPRRRRRRPPPGWRSPRGTAARPCPRTPSGSTSPISARRRPTSLLASIDSTIRSAETSPIRSNSSSCSFVSA